jgi:non-specific serine/threonine protein kinase
MLAQETSAPAAKTAPVRSFGRFELRKLLGKSERSMCWLVFDPRASQELMLTLPRVQPADAAELETWMTEAKRAARLNHPNLAHVVEVGVEEHWPYVAVDRALGVTLAEHLGSQRSQAAGVAVGWIVQALQGLAFAHEANLAHGDLQLHHLVLSEQGTLRVMGLAVAGAPVKSGSQGTSNERALAVDTHALRASRNAAERDVLTVGLVLHQLLSGTPALDEPDTARVIDRLPPLGREIVRLPWTTPHPVPEALRAIANRGTDRQERQRYHNARTLLRALTGWQEVEANDNGGALALMIDRLRTVGHLPAGPGVGARVGRLAMSDSQRTDEIAEQILEDMALSFELLRNVNSAQVQTTQMSGSGPVLTIRRAVALLGLKGVRNAASALRAWPGPLNEAQAARLKKLMDRVRLAGHLAQLLRPAGYDAEVIYLIAAMQNLGRLMVQYHFPEEAEQIEQLMQSLPPEEPGEPEQPGMTEEAASYAVLGIATETLGAAVARHWGLNDEVLHMIRRLSVTSPVRHADSDLDALRVAASAANEAVDVLTRTTPQRIASALAQVATRYARSLEITPKDLTEALQVARQLAQGHSPAAALREPARQPEGSAAVAPRSGFAALMAARHS